MARVLIVDDEPDVLEILSDIIAGFGHDVSTALNGAEGLSIVRMTPPDVILLDLVMPVMTGRDALAHLRDEHPEIPVIVVAAEMETALTEQLSALGAFGYITKPFRMEEISQMLAAALARRSGPA